MIIVVLLVVVVCPLKTKRRLYKKDTGKVLISTTLRAGKNVPLTIMIRMMINVTLVLQAYLRLVLKVVVCVRVRTPELYDMLHLL